MRLHRPRPPHRSNPTAVAVLRRRLSPPSGAGGYRSSRGGGARRCDASNAGAWRSVQGTRVRVCGCCACLTVCVRACVRGWVPACGVDSVRMWALVRGRSCACGGAGVRVWASGWACDDAGTSMCWSITPRHYVPQSSPTLRLVAPVRTPALQQHPLRKPWRRRARLCAQRWRRTTRGRRHVPRPVGHGQ